MGDNHAEWVAQTTNALQGWRDALARYWSDQCQFSGRDRGRRDIEREISQARTAYRNRILLAYRKLLLPMARGECVPDEVATLIAEEWDEETRDG